jgi:hypothetical protein
MSIKKYFLVLIVFLGFNAATYAQPVAPGSGNASAANKEAAMPVNNYTGIPSISVPIYSYQNHNGLNFGVSLDYMAGGIKINEMPSASGLGWNLSAGGVITRTVRGLPDDSESYGFLQQQTIPTDPRNIIADYHRNCIDGEQDIFQFNFAGRSGKFYLGKDSSIFLVPFSKLKITVLKRNVYDDDDTLAYSEPLEEYERPPLADLYGTITAFVITTEDGSKYFFEAKESQRTYVNKCYQIGGYPILKYGSAWYLSKIMAPTAKDSIKIIYKKLPTDIAQYRNQTATIINGVTTHSDTSSYFSGMQYANNMVAIVPSEVHLPDNKKIVFSYNKLGQFRFGQTPLLRRIKIQDSIFRYGFILNWDTAAFGPNSRSFLNGIDQYTESTLKEGYRFTYNGPFFKTVNDTSINFDNKKDHWGFYNAANNSKDYVPTVPGLYNGANRTPNAAAIASSLAAVKDPTGGTTYYDFENNDVYPLQHSRQSININAAAASQTAVSIGKVLGTKTYFKLTLDLTNTDLLTMPITGNGDLVVSITNTAGTTVIATTTLNLQNIYYYGKVSFAFTVPTGNYLLKTALGAGTASSMVLPVQISWYNQANTVSNATLSGGIRIKQVRHFDPFSNKMDTLSTYKYVLGNGKSSGFITAIPVYDYELLSNSPANKRFILSSTINELDYSQGSTIGYSRVEVYKGSLNLNLGKQVFEYSNINDDDFDNSPVEYPYMYTNKKDWALGLPKIVTTYDNIGRLIQVTKNIYSNAATVINTSVNHTSIKTGQVSEYYNDYAVKFKDFRSEKYYPVSGRIDLNSILDTFFHPNNSISTSKKEFFYDTNFNIVKMVTPYDLNKNLNVEKRLYYPYNYTIGGAIGKLRDSGIFAPVSTENWLVGDANPRLLSLSATFFEAGKLAALNAGIKATKTYALETNKPIPQTQIGLFNPAVLLRDTIRIKQQQAMLYDIKGRIIQTTSLPAGVNNSVIYGNNSNRVIAQVSNAKHSDVAYTSFEQSNEGNFAVTGNGYDFSQAITGNASFNLAQGEIYTGTLNELQTYLITYWTTGNVLINNTQYNVNLLEQRNGWSLCSQKVTGVYALTISGYGNIDELRLHPIDANMATTCYEPTGETSCTCDANNNIVYNEYDAIKRPLLVRDKDKNIIKKFEYSDTYQFINQLPNWQPTSLPLECDRDSNDNFHGVVNRIEEDMNPLSETFQTQRKVFDHYDSVACPFPILTCGPDPWRKSINGVCETGCKVTTASVYKKVNLGGYTFEFRWVCTYHYLWSDGSVSPNYTEINLTSCPLGNPCIVTPPVEI